MIQVNTKTRKWGNSVGVIIPNEVIKEQGIKEGQEVIMTIISKKKTTGEEIFGKLKFKKPIQVLLDETDKDFEPEG